MKISLFGKLAAGCAMALVAGTAFADATPNATDSSGDSD